MQSKAAGRSDWRPYFLCDKPFVATLVRRSERFGAGTVYRAEQSGGDVRSIAMAEERDNEQTNETEGTSSQQPAGQQNQQQPIAGQQGQQSEFGQQQSEQAGGLASQQTSTGGQGATGQTQSSGNAGTTTDERGFGQSGQTSQGGQTSQSGQGFVGSQGTGSDEYLREDSSGTIDRSDFASQGRGAKEGLNENLETGERQESESDIEGGDNA